MSESFFPPPPAMGLPDLFTDWRPGQEQAILAAMDTDRRFTGLVLPTGFGKSLVYMAIAHLSGQQTVILTSTKALQRQLMRDFAALQAQLVQGQRAYICTALSVGGELYHEFGQGRDHNYVDHGPCHFGVSCSLKAGGCQYFDALDRAQHANIVVTNYAWWITVYKRPDYALHPQLIVMDEAHAAPDALADGIGATVPARLFSRVLSESFPKFAMDDGAAWVNWARVRRNQLASMLEGARARTREAIEALRDARTLLASMENISMVRPELLVVTDEQDGLKFDVAWAAGFAEQWLFRRVPKIVMTSATITRKTADLLGVMDRDLFFYEAGDGFPLARRPVYITPARKPPFGDPLRVDHRMTTMDEEAWLEHIDRILDGRQDRKGIIHSVSYRRRDHIISKSRHRERMVTHGRHDTAQMIQRFKQAAPGTVLVSPAVTTGYDFPYTECEFQIVSKIPFPDGRDPITKARSLVDSRYPAHLAMQELIQSVGRGMRAEDDQCETFIVDAHATWFLAKHSDLAPKWFRRAVKRLEAGSIPTPPLPLEATS